MSLHELILGRLTWSAIPWGDVLTLGAGVSVFVVAIAVCIFITIKRRWKWLFTEWLGSLDPKKIGMMYIIVSLIMLLRGFADALMMRAQQALSAGDLHGIVSTDTFQQVFSAHGTIMIFFVAMGLVFGFLNLIVPLQIGARDVAFPTLNSISFWLFAAGMGLINLSLLVGEFSAAGWLAYPPLSGIQYSPGVGVDYWIWSLQIAGVGSLMSGINFIITILTMRRKGMTLFKMPIFTWTALTSMGLVAAAFPVLTATLFMLSLDRLLGMHFFTSGAGGNPMMYVNLIWAWGHPEVYILVLPAFGIFSEIVPVFSKKKLFGYHSMVWAILAIGLLSFTVWLHHFFTMGSGANVNAFFGIMTGVIAIPTGVKLFNWIFTMVRGRVKFTTPMLWFLGFVILFTVGGFAGVILSVPAADFQLHNSLFLVAHFHTMIVAGVLFGVFAGITYWFPKFIGFKLNEKLGTYAWLCWVLGFLTAFIPLYILGFLGATRRLDHYDASLGWQGLFIVAGVGVAILAFGVFFQILQLIVSYLQRNKPGNRDLTGDPWGGRTLEWSTTSPPPHYNFAALEPVHERDAFWAQKQEGDRLVTYEDIVLPKNSYVGLFIAGFAFMAGFGFIWHIIWMIVLGILGIIISVIARSFVDDTEYVIDAPTVKKLEEANA
jgi:cytochrome o ubiquinol oxidase subunit I